MTFRSVAHTAASPIRRWKVRREIALLARRGAVIVDTETTDFDGLAIEVAVVDFKTGAVLMESLIEPEARRSRRVRRPFTVWSITMSRARPRWWSWLRRSQRSCGAAPSSPTTQGTTEESWPVTPTRSASLPWSRTRNGGARCMRGRRSTGSVGGESSTAGTARSTIASQRESYCEPCRYVEHGWREHGYNWTGSCSMPPNMTPFRHTGGPSSRMSGRARRSSSTAAAVCFSARCDPTQ